MTRGPSMNPANAIPAGTFRGPTCGICFWQTRSDSHRSRRCITCAAISMSCAKSVGRSWREASRTTYERSAQHRPACDLLEFRLPLRAHCRTIDFLASQVDFIDLPGIGDVVEGVRVEHYEIRGL